MLFLFENVSGSLIISSISTVPDTISPGESSKISIYLKNNGNYDLEDISINMDLSNLPFAPYNSGSYYTFDKLNEGDTKKVEFEITAQPNAKSGLYKIPLKIEYNENSQTKIRNSVVSVVVNSEPSLKVILEENVLLAGQENKIVMKIINNGLSDAKFVEVNISQVSNYYTILSPESVYIGDIDSDDYQTLEFKLFFKKNIPSIINLPIVVYYKDANNNAYSQKFEIQLKVYTKSKAEELGLIKRNMNIYYLLGFFSLVILFLIYRFVRRRKIEEQIA